MILVGLTGAIGHGKSSLADGLIRAVPGAQQIETYQVVAEVINSLHQHLSAVPAKDNLVAINDWLSYLPEILSVTVHQTCDFRQIELIRADIDAHPENFDKLFTYLAMLRINPNLIKQPITGTNKEHYRPMLQWLGGYLVKRVDKGVWYKEILRRTGLAQQVGTKLYIICGVRFLTDAEYVHKANGIIFAIKRPNFTAKDANDTTEREQQSIKANTTIINDGTLEQLNKVAGAIWLDIQSHSLKAIYHTSRL